MSGFNHFISWEGWMFHYKHQLEHPADYERQFVNMVLRHLHNVEPSDVIPQYHFKDSRGGNRYIDFVIMNDAKGFSLAIELDGLTKIQNSWDKSLNYERYTDMMVRQNDLLKLTNIESLLRFTNKQMFNQTQWVINEINQELQKQAFNTARMREQQTHQVMMLQDYQNQIAQLKQANERISTEALNIKRQSASKDRALKDMEQSHAQQIQELTEQKQVQDLNNQQTQITNMLAMLQTQMADLQAKMDKQSNAEPKNTALNIANAEPVVKQKPTMPSVTQADVDAWEKEKQRKAQEAERLRLEAIRKAHEEKKKATRKKLLPLAIIGALGLCAWGYVEIVGNPFAVDEPTVEASASYEDVGGSSASTYLNSYSSYSNNDNQYVIEPESSNEVVISDKQNEQQSVAQLEKEFVEKVEKVEATPPTAVEVKPRQTSVPVPTYTPYIGSLVTEQPTVKEPETETPSKSSTSEHRDRDSTPVVRKDRDTTPTVRKSRDVADDEGEVVEHRDRDN